MRFIRKLDGGMLAALLALGVGPSVFAQLEVDGHEIEVHGFFSQGFLYSSQNNYLTSNSSAGSFSLTDGGLNISSQFGSKLRIGAQAYARNVGGLGNGHVTLDWALADYRFTDWFGVRAGQVKTVQGLYNDTQDMEFLHTWALLPQSIYPIDLRGFNISHLGGDMYGTIHARRLGSFSYTGYAGKAPPDRGGGFQYGLQSYGYYVGSRGGSMKGIDVKWNTPLSGLLVGASYLDTEQTVNGTNLRFGGPFKIDAPENFVVFSAQYTRGPWRIEWERSRATTVSRVDTTIAGYGLITSSIPYDLRGWYAAAAYRVSKHLELGAYHSRFYPNADQQVASLNVYQPPAARHIYDQAVTARFDFQSHWDLKVEGHFMDGYGDAGTTRGFYPQDNPQGLQPKTNLLVIRLGFNR